MSVRLREIQTILTQPKGEGASGWQEILTVKVIDDGQGPYITLQTEQWTLDLEEVQGFLQTMEKMLTIHEGLK